MTGSLRFHSSGIWNGDTTVSYDGGQVMEFTITNLNILGTTITMTDTKWGDTKQAIIPPGGAADFQFNAFGAEPISWGFDVSTQSDVFYVLWELYSTWIPGDPPNPP
jgi:hypothetical protein